MCFDRGVKRGKRIPFKCSNYIPLHSQVYGKNWFHKWQESGKNGGAQVVEKSPSKITLVLFFFSCYGYCNEESHFFVNFLLILELPPTEGVVKDENQTLLYYCYFFILLRKVLDFSWISTS